MGSSMLRKLRASLVTAALVIPGVAAALSVGSYQVNSSLNQPLDLRIQINDVRGLGEHEIVARLAAKSESDKLGIEFTPINNSLRFAVTVLDHDRAEVRVTSRESVREPLISLLVEYAWPRGRLFREYNILLNPPVYQSAGASSPPQHNVQEEAALPVTRSTSRTRSYTVRANDTLSIIASSHRPSNRVSVQQTMLAIRDKNPHAFINNNINLLKVGARISLPTESEAMQKTAAQARTELQGERAAPPRVTTPKAATQVEQALSTEPVKAKRPEPAVEEAPATPVEAETEPEVETPLEEAIADVEATETVEPAVEETPATPAEAATDPEVEAPLEEARVDVETTETVEPAVEETPATPVEAETEPEVETPLEEAIADVEATETVEPAVEETPATPAEAATEPEVETPLEEAIADVEATETVEPAVEETPATPVEAETEPEVEKPLEEAIADVEATETVEPAVEETPATPVEAETKPEEVEAPLEETTADVETTETVAPAVEKETAVLAKPKTQPSVGSKEEASLIKRVLSNSLFLMVLLGLLLLVVVFWLVSFWQRRQQNIEEIPSVDEAEKPAEIEPAPVNLAALKEEINILMKEERYAEAVPLLRTAVQNDPTHIGLKKTLLEALYHFDKKAHQQEVTKLKGMNAELDKFIAAQLARSGAADYTGLGEVPIVTETMIDEGEPEDDEEMVAEEEELLPTPVMEQRTPAVETQENADYFSSTEELPSTESENMAENHLFTEEDDFFGQQQAEGDLALLLAEIEEMDDADALGEATDFELSLESGDYNEHDTGLSLARALIEMGSAEEARDTLEEVLQDGTVEQKAEAQKLLNEINS